MTEEYKGKKSTAAISSYRELMRTLISVLTVIAALFISVRYSDRISHSVKSALSLCANVIIPSVFPFMILSDLLYSSLDFSAINYIGVVFEKLFKINRIGIYPFLLGLTCGFPLGVKCASDMYREGLLTKKEAERLIGFSNNTGPAFLVSGVGMGLRGNVSDGILLYVSMVLAAVAVGILFSFGEGEIGEDRALRQRSKFSLTRSVKNAGAGTLNVCSYLTFFACAIGLLRNLLGESYVYLALISFLEIGSATSIFSKTLLLDSTLSLTLSAFAVGFSGLSVHLQSLSYISETDIPTRKYFIMKSVQGVLTAALAYILKLIAA